MKKVIGLILIVLVLLAVVPGSVMTAQAEAEVIPKTSFYYIDSNGEYQLAEDYEGVIFINSDVTEVTITDAVYGVEHKNTSIVLLSKRTEALELTIEELQIASTFDRPAIDFKNAGAFDNKLYISEICNLTSASPYGCINVPEGAKLEIDKLAGLEDDEAQLTVTNNEWHGAGIGGGLDGENGAGTIIISGGTITASGGFYAAGIGGGHGGAGGTITINDGIVNATGGIQGAGIGGGVGGNGGNITINGGNVTAFSAHGGAGIGGGNFDSSGGHAGGNITINAGIVTATCAEWGAGIGGGCEGNGGTVIINGGTVTANGGAKGAAGIGGGYNGEGGSTTINGGTVIASGKDGGTGIGGGAGRSGVSTVINGGTVTANGSYCAAGIGGGWNGETAGIVVISGGSVYAYGGSSGAGIGGGFGCSGAEVTIIGTPVVFASTRNDWGDSNAMNIGHGYEYKYGKKLSPGTLKDGEGNNLSYISFSSKDIYGDGLPGIKIIIDGIDDVYYTDNQGVFWMFVPYKEADLYSYTMSKVRYKAVKGSQALSSVSHSISAVMIPDTVPPVIRALRAVTTRIAYITCDNYDIYGTLFMVPGSETIYTSKAALEGVSGRISIALVNNYKNVMIDASELSEGSYQFYLVDSADNVSSPLTTEVPFSLRSKSNGDSSVGNSSSSILKTPVLNSGGNTAGIEVNMATLDNAFRKAVANAEGITAITLEMPGVAGAESYEANIPAEVLAGAPGKAIKLKTELGEVTLPSDMLTWKLAGNAKSAAITIGKGDISKLPSDIQRRIGNRPVIELTLKLDGNVVPWSNPSAPVTISIPYSPTEEELKAPEHITIWYIDGSGNAISVPSGRYDPVTGRVSFKTSHFSMFAVVYVTESFNDLDIVPWAKKQIEVLASKGIMDGRIESEFAPNAEITRGEYIGALVRTLGISASFDDNFSDVKATDNYYYEIGTAKSLGITTGTGNGFFSPEASISRQDMLVLTERALRSLKKVSKSGTLIDLEQFTDRTQLSEYAVKSIAALVKEGLVEGSNGKLNLGLDSTRAEAAVFLYRIYNK